MDTSLVSTIGAADVFASLDPEERLWLASQCHSRRYGKGQQVFLRGDPGDCLYVIASGSVSISVLSPSGDEVVLAILWPPQIFGELAVIDGGPRTATATTREASTLVHVPRSAMRELLPRAPAMALAVMNSLAALVRRVDEQTTDLVLVELPGRVAKLLTTIALAAPEAASRRTGEPVPVDLRISQTELAHQVGGSRQQVNRILMALEASGAIQRTAHRIVAIRPELLTGG
jgi:CRP/FNR family transcriptional regulator, cyclic AMP receptor protein